MGADLQKIGGQCNDTLKFQARGRRFCHQKITNIPLNISAGATLLEKILDVVILLLFSSLGFFLRGSYLIAGLLGCTGILLLPAIFLLLPILRRIRHSKIQELAASLSRSLVTFTLRTLRSKYFFEAGFFSIFNWLASLLEAKILFSAFGANIPFAAIFAYLPLAIFVGLLPISIAGLGTRDSALIAFFLPWASPAQSLATGVGYLFIGYLLFAVIGIPFLIREFRLGLLSNNKDI